MTVHEAMGGRKIREDFGMKIAKATGTPDARAIAQSIALEQHNRVLILVGRLDGKMGLPKLIEGYSGDIELRMISNITQHITTGIFEVKDEDTLCAAIDDLQESGGYRATVVNVDGSIDPAYTI